MNTNITKSGAIRPRYSNAGVGSGMFVNLGVGGDYSDVATKTTYSASGSGFDIDAAIQSGMSLLQSIVGLFSPSSKYTSQMYKQQYEQQKQTTTILWVVIGLVIALGVVLVIRKTK